MNKKIYPHSIMKVYKGESIFPGLVLGNAEVVKNMLTFEKRLTTITQDSVEQEKNRFNKAVEISVNELKELLKKSSDIVEKQVRDIFNVHLQILNDEVFIREILNNIKSELLNSEGAITAAVEQYKQNFSNSASEQIKAKIADLVDIKQRLISHLYVASTQETMEGIKKKTSLNEAIILVTQMLLPSTLASLDRNKVKGIVTELGSKYSHSAVIAHSLGIPIIFDVNNVVSNIQDEDELIVDGTSGTVFLHPTEELKGKYKKAKEKFIEYQNILDSQKKSPAVTQDRKKIELYANVGMIEDLDKALQNNADGVGLFRTEIPFLLIKQFPDERLQVKIFRKVVEGMKGKPVGIRLFDIGSDKVVSYLPIAKELNPNLGWRAIRIFLDNPDLLKIHMRAILKASAYGNAKVIIPMVCILEEVLAIKQMLYEVSKELERDGEPFKKDIQLGIMIEVPSAVLIAEHLIKEVDFFCVGTNDLIQYTLAIDRDNPRVSKYFDPLSPPIIQMLQKIACVTKQERKDLYICGMMAAEPLYIPLLIGMGYEKLSVNPHAIGIAKDIIRNISFDDAEILAQEIIKKKTGLEIKEILVEYFSRIEKTYDIYFHSLGEVANKC
ncbi:MAG: phosphoenolpyruvate--protein phosphotransferase [bacterium]